MAPLLKVKRGAERFGRDTIAHVREHARKDGFVALCMGPRSLPQGFALYYTTTLSRLHLVQDKVMLGHVIVSAKSYKTDKLVSVGVIEEVHPDNLEQEVSGSLNQFAAALDNTAIAFVKSMEQVVKLHGDGWKMAMNGEVLSKQLNVPQCGAFGRVFEFTNHVVHNESPFFEFPRTRDMVLFEQKIRNILARVVG
ncbi:MAG: hypothetical protein KGI70_00985 [Patescibacteria group bacterium]|nr:hypothetical protein [Patescibacteria group bacterium]